MHAGVCPTSKALRSAGVSVLVALASAPMRLDSTFEKDFKRSMMDIRHWYLQNMNDHTLYNRVISAIVVMTHRQQESLQYAYALRTTQAVFGYLWTLQDLVCRPIDARELAQPVLQPLKDALNDSLLEIIRTSANT